MELEKFTYDNKLNRMFLVASVIWGVVGMLAGLTIALELIFPNLSQGISWLSFGRLRPLHTNAAIFAFVGNIIFLAVYYSTPRLLKTPMFSKMLWAHSFLGMAVDHCSWQQLPCLLVISKQRVCRVDLAHRRVGQCCLGGIWAGNLIMTLILTAEPNTFT